MLKWNKKKDTLFNPLTYTTVIEIPCMYKKLAYVRIDYVLSVHRGDVKIDCVAFPRPECKLCTRAPWSFLSNKFPYSTGLHFSRDRCLITSIRTLRSVVICFWQSPLNTHAKRNENTSFFVVRFYGFIRVQQKSFVRFVTVVNVTVNYCGSVYAQLQINPDGAFVLLFVLYFSGPSRPFLSNCKAPDPRVVLKF